MTGLPSDKRGDRHDPRHPLGDLGPQLDLGPEVAKRFWAKVEVDSDGCWNWTACRSPKGYGLFGFAGRLRPAHRLAYEVLVGPIPKGLTIDHLCRNRACIRPSHLEPVTNRENIYRGYAPSAVNARKTHCHAGHPLNGANLYVEPSGKRVCRSCRRLRSRSYRQRQAAIRMAVSA